MKAGVFLARSIRTALRESRVPFLLPSGYVATFNLSAEIELRPGVFKPVAWRCEQTLNPDGSILVELRGPNDAGSRKGIQRCTENSPECT